MKKLLIASVLALGLTGCYKCIDDTNVAGPWTYHGNSCQTKVVNIDNHKYIIMDGNYCGNIIHAESCHCKNN